MFNGVVQHYLWSVLHWAAGHMPLVLGGWGFFWTVGAIGKGVKVTGKTLLGVGIFFGLVGVLWKRRRDVGRGVVVVATTVIVAGWAIALYLSPSLRWDFFVPLGIVVWAGLFWPVGWPFAWVPGGWVAEKCGDRPWADVLREWVESHAVRAQVTTELGPEAFVGRASKAGNDWRVDTARPGNPDQIDTDAVGGRVNKVTDVRDVRVIPGDKVGHATLILSPDAPEPDMTPWERYGQLGAQRWPGPSTSDVDGPMRFLFDQYGRPLPVPVPGVGGGSLLFSGATGSGKSGTLHVMIADLAFRHDLAIIFLDPHGVEGGLWRERCSIVAEGADDCLEVIGRLPALMEGRAKRMKHRFWRVREDGPRVLIVCDEYTAIIRRAREKKKSVDGMTRWLAETRKFGGGSVLSLQRSHRENIGMDERDNLRVRLALGAESPEASRMTLGVTEPSATDIPEGLKGACYVRVDRQIRPARSYLLSPPGILGPDDDPIELAALQIARATASLNIDPRSL